MSAAESAPVWRPGRSKQGAANAMPRRKFFKRDSWEFGHESAADEQPLAEPRKRRTATTVAYAALFFAGATFTAVAGDRFAQMNAADDATSASADATLTDTTTDTTTTPADDALASPRAEASSDGAAPSRATAPADSQAPPPARASNDAAAASAASPSSAPQGNGSAAPSLSGRAATP